MEWQDIETAPRDGTEILICHAESGTMLVAGWDKRERDDWPWCTADGPSYHRSFASHWMPLPEAPRLSAALNERGS